MSLKSKLSLALVTTAIGATLIGAGTFAIFTSSATNAGNTFTAGTLKIGLEPATAIIDVDNMAPGDSGSQTLTVANNGSLELRYDIAEELTGALAAGADGLKVTIEDAAGNVITPGDNNRVLAAGATEVLTIGYELPLAADNTYQGAEATLGITVNAEQTANN
jgi:predicted ribosomally synthesized peptide with SipW-like signal peptide